MKKVIIVDYKLGNIFSVKQACEEIGMNVSVSSQKTKILEADALILPGVGAFNEAMNHLNDLDLIDVIKKHAYSGKPIFGICLGLQLLFTESEEFGSTKGLNIIPGIVKKIDSLNGSSKRLVPQIGWNKVHKSENPWDDTPLRNITSEEYFYFVHSYYVVPSDEKDILGETIYDGLEYCSAVFKNDNIFATQFHPEKSAHKGLEIYKSWANQYNLM